IRDSSVTGVQTCALPILRSGMTETADPLNRPLKRGWTTGSCATAAARAAYELLMTGSCPAIVDIALPGGRRASFAVAIHEAEGEIGRASCRERAGVRDAG